MKTAGSILSALFDERFVKKAQGYSKLFNSWTDITEKNGIAAAADHSRVKDLDRDILLIEVDHPGWKQILQTKQSKLLNDFRYRFPGLGISGIALILGSGKEEIKPNTDENTQRRKGTENTEKIKNESFAQNYQSDPAFNIAEREKGLDAIKDDDFKETLKNLGQTIADREKK